MVEILLKYGARGPDVYYKKKKKKKSSCVIEQYSGRLTHRKVDHTGTYQESVWIESLPQGLLVFRIYTGTVCQIIMPSAVLFLI